MFISQFLASYLECTSNAILQANDLHATSFSKWMQHVQTMFVMYEIWKNTTLPRKWYFRFNNYKRLRHVVVVALRNGFWMHVFAFLQHSDNIHLWSVDVLTLFAVENVGSFKAALPIAGECGDMPISKIHCVFKVRKAVLPEMVSLTVCFVLQEQ